MLCVVEGDAQTLQLVSKVRLLAEQEHFATTAEVHANEDLEKLAFAAALTAHLAGKLDLLLLSPNPSPRIVVIVAK